jgi:Trypsin
MSASSKQHCLAGVLGLAGVLLSAASCTTALDEPKDKRVAAAQQPILNGALDMTHGAVLYVLGDGGACTGTMIKVDTTKKVGWVLTAAHCIGEGAEKPTNVYQGNDVNVLPNQLRRYIVLDAVAHPSYNPNTLVHDLGMIRVYGVDAQTPVIPVTNANDGLILGQPVTSVGYGITAPADVNPASDNSARRTITKPIASLSAAAIGYNQSPAQNPSGICSGDSGGPVLAKIGGTKSVVGVHSYVLNECRDAGFSVRVSSELPWLTARLADPIPNLNTCSSCQALANSGSGLCAARLDACLGARDCRSLYTCYRDCKTISCRSQCTKDFPLGLGPLLDAAGDKCQCADACSTQCKTDATCRSVAACGVAVLASACGTCQEEKCCAETSRASADGLGYQCLNATAGDANCDANAPYAAVGKCLLKNCATECKLIAPAEPTPPPVRPTPTADAGVDPAPQPVSASNDGGGGCSVATGSNPRRNDGDAACVGLGAALGLVGLRQKQRNARQPTREPT